MLDPRDQDDGVRLCNRASLAPKKEGRGCRMIFRQFVQRIREPKRWREIAAEVG